MKKMLLLIGLLVLSVLVVGCTEGTLAGQAVSSKSFVAKGDIISLNGEILEYRGADRDTTRDPKIRFHQWSNGETLDYSIVSGQASIVSSTEGSLPAPGIFNVQLVNPLIIDSPLIVDYNGDGALDRIHQLTSFHFMSPGLNAQCDSSECLPPGLRCDNILILLEGETMRTTAPDLNGISGEHDVTINMINSTSVRLVVDALPETIHNRQSEVVNNVLVTAWYVLFQGYAGGVHSVTLCVGE